MFCYFTFHISSTYPSFMLCLHCIAIFHLLCDFLIQVEHFFFSTKISYSHTAKVCHNSSYSSFYTFTQDGCRLYGREGIFTGLGTKPQGESWLKAKAMHVGGRQMHSSIGLTDWSFQQPDRFTLYFVKEGRFTKSFIIFYTLYSRLKRSDSHQLQLKMVRALQILILFFFLNKI